jgi:hypothetical protein
METIKKIVCFGLGTVKDENFEHAEDGGEGHLVGQFLQHVAALDIRKNLLELQKAVPDIPIYVQDPAYCTNCKTVLQSYGMIVLENNEAFLKVTGNSFVIARAPDVAIRQLVIDKTQPYGGPAGILCDRIMDYGGGENVFQMRDRSNPRLWEYIKKNKDLGLLLDNETDTIEIDGKPKMPCQVFGEAHLCLKKKT